MGKVRVMGIVNVTPDSFSGDGVIDADAAVARGLAMAEAGADMVDVGGESTRPGHLPVTAEEELRRAVPVVEVLMHNQDGTDYAEDVMSAVKRSLRASAAVAIAAGVPPDRLVVDPGIGFGKTPEHNLVILRRLGELRELGYPILVGPSRKSFLGRLFGQEMPIRPWGTAAAVTAAILRGADIVRVHDLPEMLAVVQVAEALKT